MDRKEHLNFVNHLSRTAAGLVDRAEAAGPQEAEQLLREADEIIGLLETLIEAVPRGAAELSEWLAEPDPSEPDPEPGLLEPETA